VSIFTLTLSSLGLILIGLRIAVTIRYEPRILSDPFSFNCHFALVFGAGLHRDGSPTNVLRDRVECAASLIANNTVESLILSGGGNEIMNETQVMQVLALNDGINPGKLVIDPLGSRTITSLIHAKQNYGLKKLLLVTQKFHLYRALLLADALGIEALGIPADLHHYRLISRLWWSLREIPATSLALFEMFLIKINIFIHS